jgi:putative membrane protein
MEWLYNLNGFWIFPLLCLLFTALMMLGCRGMRFGFGHGGASCRGRESAREILERRYAGGEISKEQYEAMRRELNG